MKIRTMIMVVAASLSLASMSYADDAVTVDSSIPVYVSVSGVSGNLNSVGSDTLNNLMTYWSEGFKEMYPNVNIQIEGKGSSTAPPALIEGTAQLGPMSRKMKSSETDKFEDKYSYSPTPIRVAVDALAVFVHKDNPITGLNLQQADSIFSHTLKRGGSNVDNWGQLGLSGQFANLPISLYGRNSASGTYGFFKDEVLKGGDYKDTVKEQPGSSAVVQGVASDLGGIGYSGIGYKTSGVKAIPLAKEGAEYLDPSFENAISGKYPLSRFLYVYVNKHPEKGLDTLTKEFLKFVLSKKGQEIVIKDGFYPISSNVAEKELKKVG